LGKVSKRGVAGDGWVPAYLVPAPIEKMRRVFNETTTTNAAKRIKKKQQRQRSSYI
jgi:hypothetical protein